MTSPNSGFHTTRWTLVRLASGKSAEGRQALSELCEICYEPVVAFLRRSGRDGDAARELAHEFFAHVLERPNLGGAEPGRGRFRSYLLGALKHHISHRRASEARQKRGGGIETIPLDAGTDTSPGLDPGDAKSLPPDREFDRQWALHILRRATAALAAEWNAEGKADEFAALQPFIGGESVHGDLASLAATRGASAAALRQTVSRLRQQFRQQVKACIAPTLSESRDTDEEMRELLAALVA
jgi:DNA-directed RNA polymerase specialized sigma24 family protein